MNLRVSHENQVLQNGGRNIGGTSQTEETTSVSQAAYRLARNIRNMNVGDTFTGRITNLDGQAVELMLADKSLLNAKLSQRMNLQTGQTMSFEITGNGGGKVQLTPLYANLAGDNQVAKALNAAQLPVDSRNAEMVQAMMKEGMSIDVNSLLDMSKSVSAYPQAAPTSIVLMNKLGIPLSQENVEQFEIYKNNSHQMASEISTLSDSYVELAAKDPALNDSLLKIFTSEDTAASLESLNNALAAAGEEAAAVEDGAEATAVQDSSAEKAAAGVAQSAEAAISEEAEILQPSSKDLSTGETFYGKNTVSPDLDKLMSPEERNALADKMEELGVPKSITTNVRNAGMSTGETLDMIKTAIDDFSKTAENKDQFQSALSDLTKSNEYGKLLKNEIMGKLLLSPEEVADKDKVREYYERVVRDTTRMSQALSDSGRADTALFKDTQNIRDNVDFMNQLNQVFTYVQLPLKLNDQSSHGDLYVYTNKKRLAQKDGNVSALLHLEMDHLGTMDVHVSMNDTGNVKTHFIMQKEELLDFIADHLPELNERLEKRGYKVTSDVALNREEKNVPQIMFNTGKDDRLVQRLTFDVKA